MDAGPGGLAVYVPRMLRERAGPQIWQQEGTLVFSDLSGFTRLGERLARRGRAGAEELVHTISLVFTELLTASDDGGDVLQFGGDGLLLFYEGAQHAERACHSAHRMRQALARLGGIDTAGGRVRLRMSTGISTGTIHFALAGGDLLQLYVVGPDASHCMHLESAADGNEILVSRATAARLGGATFGGEKAGGLLLRRHRPLEGVGLGTSAVRVPSSRAARFVPGALRERLAFGGESEHRQVTVAFVGFEGLDELVATRHAATVLERLAALSVAVQGACDELGVTVIATDCAVDGGKLMLVAGAPTAAEDTDGRMLHACRRILRADVGLPLRIGVNRGRAFCGDVGAAFRRTYSTMGDAVNLAARLLGTAPAGGLVAARPVVEHSRARFTIDELPPFPVRGRSAPVAAVLVGDPVPQASGGEAHEPRLVGRAGELGQLEHAVRAAADGCGRVIEVVGEAGVGKSRLVLEAQSRSTGLEPVLVPCDRFNPEVPYASARQLLRHALGVPAAAPARDAAAALQSVEQAFDRETVAQLSLLAPVIGAEPPSIAAVDDLAPRFRRARLHDAARRVLTTTLGPACLVIDDSGAMDEASVELFRALLRDVDDRPWLVLVTRRHGTAPLLPRAETMVLEPLARQWVDALLDELTEDRPLAPGLADAIAERCEGNPRFLVELVAAGHDTADGVLPASVEAVLASRIDRLSEADRRVLRAASVLGVEFPEELLSRLVGAGSADPWRRLGAFLEPAGGVLRFRVALYRDAAYGGLSYAARRRLHGRVFDLLAERSEDAESARLSLHAHAAERFADSWRFSRLSGERARDAAAPAEATTAFARALAAARRLPSLPPAEVAATAEALGDAAERAGRYATAADAYRQARALRSDAESTSRLLRKSGTVCERQGRYPSALRWYTRALAVAAEITEPGERARALAAGEVAYAVVRQGQGQLRASVAWADRAVSHALQGRDWAALATAYHLLGEAHADLGDGRARHFRDLALPIFEEIGDFVGLGITLDRLGDLAYHDGRWVEALRLYERASSARRRAGDHVGAATSDTHIAQLLSDQGGTRQAATMFRRARTVFRAAGYPVGVAITTSNLGLAAVRSGRPDEGLALIDEALAAFASLGAEPLVSDALTRRAEALLAVGRSVEAWEAATEALQRGAHGVLRARAERLRGQALAATGGRRRARECLEAALEHARALGARYEEGLAHEAIAELGEEDAAGQRAQGFAILLGLGAHRAIDALERSAGAVAAGGSMEEARNAT